MDRFAALSAFVAVAEHRGFAAAARKLGVATSSVTRQVDALEATLGTLLVNRSTRSVTLTDAGARYAEDARRILDELADADRSVSEGEGPPSGLLRVSLPTAFARLHVAPVVPRFLASCPKLSLNLVAADGIVNLAEERIDVAIRLGPLPPSSLIARRLAPHRRIVCASPSYLAARGVPRSPQDLSGHECLAFDYGGGLTTWRFACDGGETTVPIADRLRSNNADVLREAAIGGAGLTMMPSWLVGPDVVAGRLVRVLADWTVDPGSGEGAISAVYLPSRRGSAKLRTFLDFLVAHFGDPPYWEGDASLRTAQR